MLSTRLLVRPVSRCRGKAPCMSECCTCAYPVASADDAPAHVVPILTHLNLQAREFRLEVATRALQGVSQTQFASGRTTRLPSTPVYSLIPVCHHLKLWPVGSVKRSVRSVLVVARAVQAGAQAVGVGAMDAMDRAQVNDVLSWLQSEERPASLLARATRVTTLL